MKLKWIPSLIMMKCIKANTLNIYPTFFERLRIAVLVASNLHNWRSWLLLVIQDTLLSPRTLRLRQTIWNSVRLHIMSRALSASAAEIRTPNNLFKRCTSKINNSLIGTLHLYDTFTDASYCCFWNSYKAIQLALNNYYFRCNIASK